MMAAQVWFEEGMTMSGTDSKGSVQVRGRQQVYRAPVDEVAAVISGFERTEEVAHFRRARAFRYRIDRFDGSGYGCQISVTTYSGGSLVTVSESGWANRWTPIRHAANVLHVRRLQASILSAIDRGLRESPEQIVGG